MSNVATDVKAFMVAGLSIDETNITVSRMPATGQVNIAEGQWVVILAGGSKSGGNLLQWKRTHSITVLHRSKSGEALYNKDDELQALFAGCTLLDNYRVLRATCNPGTELPLAAKEVHVMQWALTLDIVTR